MIKNIILILLLFSCSSNNLNTVRYIEQDFEEIVLDFEEMYGIYVNYPVVYVDQLSAGGSSAIAICLTQDGGPVRIEILKDDYIVDNLLWLVIWHELSHCSLGLSHYNDEIDIMNSSVGRALWSLNTESETRESLVQKLNNRISFGPTLPSFYNPEEENGN